MGKWGLLFGFYLPGVRHLIGFGAGIAKLPVPVFARFAFTGAFIWSATFVSAGYFLGREWTLIFGKIRPTLVTSSVVIVSFFLLYILVQQSPSVNKNPKRSLSKSSAAAAKNTGEDRDPITRSMPNGHQTECDFANWLKLLSSSASATARHAKTDKGLYPILGLSGKIVAKNSRREILDRSGWQSLSVEDLRAPKC